MEVAHLAAAHVLARGHVLADLRVQVTCPGDQRLLRRELLLRGGDEELRAAGDQAWANKLRHAVEGDIGYRNYDIVWASELQRIGHLNTARRPEGAYTTSPEERTITVQCEGSDHLAWRPGSLHLSSY